MGFEKISALNEIRNMSSELPEYTLGELLYSFIRIATKGTNKVSDLLKVSDGEFLNSIEKAVEYEKGQ